MLHSLLHVGVLISLLVWFPWSAAGLGRHGRAVVPPALDRRALTPLKILPIGDSITQGYQSTDSNGYRLGLRNDLQNGGYQVTYVGDKTSGTMTNNAEDGYDGYTINQIASAIPESLNFQPNVILLHAGTNDMGKSPPPDPYASAPDRLGSLIDEILCKCPNATLIVAQIISSGKPATESRTKTYNAAIPGVVASRRKKGFKVMTIDMSSMHTLKDSVHPTDEGYKQMASFWYKAIQEATSMKWITAIGPETFTEAGNAQRCDSGLFWYPAHDAKPIATGLGTGGDGVHLADIDGDGIDDYVQINDRGQLTMYRNGGPPPKSGDGSDRPWIWYPQNGGFAVGPEDDVPPSQIRIADLDGDGKADYVVVEPQTGAAWWYQNGGPRKCGGWKWYPKGKVAAGMGDGAGVTFADINGDGRADYIWLDKNGAATVYINAIGVVSQNWTSTNGGKPIATGFNASRDSVRFADLNGDGRADYITVDALTGAADAYYNAGPKTDAAGDWIWQPQGRVSSGVGSSGSDVIFGRLVDTGRAAYITVSADTGAIVAYLNGCKNLAPVASSAGPEGAAGTGQCGKPPLA